jgi:hypothetical protein
MKTKRSIRHYVATGLVATAMILAITAVSASDQVPFRGFVSTAPNGDSISGPFSGSLTPTDVPGVFDNTELAFITSGTGRFANATGTFDLGGQIDLNTGTFFLPWEGTISTVGSGR